MRSKVDCRRSQRRHSVAPGADASIQLQHPPGCPWTLRVIDISVSGISFAFEEDAPRIDSGENLSNVVIKIGSCTMEGDLLIMHVTPVPPRTVCGALFYPATDDDLIKLKSMIAGIEAVQPGAGNG